MSRTLKLVFNLFKLRIGVVIAITALAGLAVTPGPALSGWQIAVLGLAVLLSSASAGAFNQYVERDLDLRMARTRSRPFVTGTLRHGPGWLWLIGLMVAGSVAAAALALNPVSALYVFLGAFFYAIVYTVWLKRRTWLNIVIGGLAGSFAVLAGSSAVTPALSPEAIALAVVLFLWTPPHFWSLAIAHRKDYAAAGVPMLPVVVGDARCARVILASTLVLVAASLVPAFYGLGWMYLLAAVAGGAYFLMTSIRLVRDPGPRAAMANFHASLTQLSLLLVGAMIDGGLGA
ncbi:MAG: protoheme IX farnesyltransferase [Betaproteobacteria bacterium]|nr:protoheme IX farnesyltransferase [Betaproteobacteria bacterium]